MLWRGLSLGKNASRASRRHPIFAATLRPPRWFDGVKIGFTLKNASRTIRPALPHADGPTQSCHPNLCWADSVRLVKDRFSRGAPFFLPQSSFFAALPTPSDPRFLSNRLASAFSYYFFYLTSAAELITNLLEAVLPSSELGSKQGPLELSMSRQNFFLLLFCCLARKLFFRVETFFFCQFCRWLSFVP
jgi:hypothetical protein